MRTLSFSSLLFAATILVFQPAWGETVDINSADASTLDKAMVDIGPKKAAAIVEYRTQHGPFKSVDDLEKVHGIGAETVKKNQDKVVATPPTAVTTPAATTEAPK